MTQRTPVVAGNWKMNPEPDAAIALVDALVTSLAAQPSVERVVCPPYLYLTDVAKRLADSEIGVGAQHADWRDYGAFTGEVSAAMLAGLVRYVIIGHSERRTLFGETDETVRLRVESVLRHGLNPIVCVGETLAQREGGVTGEVLRRQVRDGLDGITLPANAIIAYEPVWAIGTGRAATAAMAAEACGMIRLMVGEQHGRQRAADVRILYGGSVTAANAAELFAEPEIDGALVGGASLKADEFTRIVAAATG